MDLQMYGRTSDRLVYWWSNKSDSIETQLELISKLNDLSKYITYNSSLYEPLDRAPIGSRWKLNEGHISREAGWLEIYVENVTSDDNIFEESSPTISQDDLC